MFKKYIQKNLFPRINRTSSKKQNFVDEIKSDFVLTAAHQIRTPLATSNLYIDLLLSGHVGKLTSRQKRLLEEIDFSNKKMSELLNNFLVASKVQLGTLEVNKKLVDISELLDDVLRELKFEQKENKQKLIRNYPKHLNIFCDFILIRIALQNLLSNAIKYTPARGTITVTVKKMKKNIVIITKDTGRGISQSDQNRIFLKFHRGTNAKKGHSGGSGLGLYITKTIIESCGGKIWLKSKINQGTSFYVSLPVK